MSQQARSLGGIPAWAKLQRLGLASPSGLCRRPDGEEHPTKAFWEVRVYGAH